MSKQFNIGIEIECSYNTAIHQIQKGGYHSGILIEGLNDWKAERDGSLNSYGAESYFENSECVELISPVYKSVDEFKQGLKDFYAYISKNDKYELNKVLFFNQSCGCHVHFSVKDEGKLFIFNQKTVYQVYQKVRNYFKARLIASDINKNTVDSIISHYDREYAREIKDESYRNIRKSEFNVESEIDGKGLEWRSINLLNLTSWSDFFKFFDIVIDCLDYLYESAIKYECESQIENLIDLSTFNVKINYDVTYEAVKRNKRYLRVNLERIDNKIKINDEVYVCAI